MNDRLEFATQEEAQAFADKMHANMISVDPDYASSVAKGHTTAWAIPYQDTDVDGNPIAKSPWYVNVKDRGRKACEPADATRLKPFSKPVLVAVEQPKVR